MTKNQKIEAIRNTQALLYKILWDEFDVFKSISIDVLHDTICDINNVAEIEIRNLKGGEL